MPIKQIRDYFDLRRESDPQGDIAAAQRAYDDQLDQVRQSPKLKQILADRNAARAEAQQSERLLGQIQAAGVTVTQIEQTTQALSTADKLEFFMLQNQLRTEIRTLEGQLALPSLAGTFGALYASIDALKLPVETNPHWLDFNKQWTGLLGQIEAIRMDAQTRAANAREQEKQLDLQLGSLNEAQKALKNLIARSLRYRDYLALQSKLDQQLVPSGLQPDVPLLLFPVYLETRYMGPDLLVRVYPDDIHRNNHLAELTDNEIAWGKHFWTQLWHADSQPKQLQAWKQLVDQFGVERATYLAHQLQPTNPQDRSPAATPQFPPINPRDKNSPPPPPTALGLPDRWLVRGYTKDEQVFEKLGGLIPDPLPFGYLSEKIQRLPPEWNGKVPEPEHRWMVDFYAAKQVGMGVQIEDAPEEIELLLVMGVKAAADVSESTTVLNDILDAHHYTSGLSLVPQGTPTNNTDPARSGYATRQTNLESRFDLEIAATLFKKDDESDGDILSRALGVDKQDPLVFTHVEHANGTEQRDAAAMNAALWPATWGYYLGQLLTGYGAALGYQSIGFYPTSKLPGIVDGSLFEPLRERFIKYVRARGPLPALRVGNQPYGILPTRLSPQPGQEVTLDSPFDNLLGNLLVLWRSYLSDVPHIGKSQTAGSTNPDQDLLEILSQDALSTRYSERRVYGSVLAQSLQQTNYLIGQIPPDLFSDRERQIRLLLDILQYHPPDGLPTDRLGYSLYSEVTVPLDMGRVLAIPNGEDESLSEIESLPVNYIYNLVKMTPAEIAADVDKSDPLLKRLLRHATLWAYAETAYELELPVPNGDEYSNFNIWREPELVDMMPPISSGTREPQPMVPTVTALRYLLGDSRKKPGTSRGDLIFTDNPTRIRAFHDQLERLSQQPTAVLDRLLRETLDLCSYRLDAWVTSLATQQLNVMREQQPVGIQLGGYGWVENLKKRKGDQPLSEGLIHAPSLAHAATAAVLRSGYLARRGTESGEVLALDLSSQRVRQALDLLDGIRQGQPLGALLGYRFERALHDAGLAQYTMQFREIAPLVAGKLTPKEEGTAVESVAAGNVVDGLKLLKLNSENKIPWGDQLPSSAAAGNLVVALKDAVDSVSDLLTAESVHQMIMGNPLRGGGTVDALSRGDSPPSEIEVTRTPRSGVNLTHRLVMLLSPEMLPSLPAGWVASQPRAVAEPMLNAWMGQILGDPSRIMYSVEYLDVDGTVIKGPEDASLAGLFCPLDMLYMLPVGVEPELSEFEQRLIYEALHSSDAPTETQSVRLAFTRANPDADELSIPDALEIARVARDFITRARPLDLRDMVLPDTDIKPQYDLTELQKRASQGVVAEFKAAIISLANAIQSGASAALLGALKPFAQYDIPGAIPITIDGAREIDKNSLKPAYTAVAGDTLSAIVQRFDLALDQLLALNPALTVESIIQAGQVINITGPEYELLNRALRILKETQRRETIFNKLKSTYTAIADDTLSAIAQRFNLTLDRLLALNPGLTAESIVQVGQVINIVDQIEHELKLLQVLFGEHFQVLPRFSMGSSADTVAKALKKREDVGDAKAPDTFPWLERISHVREAVDRFSLLLSYADALNSANFVHLHVAQLSSGNTDEQWIAHHLPPKKDDRQPRFSIGQLSLVIAAPAVPGSAPLPPLASASLAGLFVDEWIEVVPDGEETTAVSFHFDAPGARAPQTILLAVPQESGQAWSWDSLAATLRDTLELAKIRGMDPDIVSQLPLGQYLPALFFAFNVGGTDPAGDTISTVFRHSP